jgi:hypothetical protein
VTGAPTRHVEGAHRAEALADATVAYLRALPGTRGPDSVRRCGELDALIAEQRHRLVIHGHLHYRVLIDFEAGTVSAFAFEDGHRLKARVTHPLSPRPHRRVWRSTAEFDGRWEPVLL